MPNWCMNTLNVSGGADEIKRFVFANQGLPAKYPPQEWEKAIAQMEPQPTESYFCFNALVPTPQEVLDMGYDAHNKISKDTLLFALHGQSISPIDGYHWNIANWGTNWDVYHDKITPDEMGWSEGCEGIEFEFDTAWSPPRDWFEQVCSMFPTLYATLHYEEPGCYFAGDIIWENGELVEVEYSQQQCEKAFAWMNDEEDDLLLGIEADEIKNG